MKNCIAIIILIGIAQISKGQNNALELIANKYLNEYKVPGLALSVIKTDTVYYGVAGVQKCGAIEKIDLNSKFQIASNTKAITATIAAMLVEDKIIKWDTKIIELFPELEGTIRREYYEVTLENLLSNRGLVQPFEEDNSKEWKNIPKMVANSENTKLEFTKYALTLEPMVNRKSNHSYSNGAFIIAALMLEKASGQKWENLVEEFNQQYNVEAVIGFPNQENESGTYGHKKRFGKYRPVSPNDEYVFPFDFSAAGNLSINITDLTTITRYHLLGLMGEDNILESATYSKLHYGHEKYSLGWYNGNIGDTNQKFSYHGGSIGTFSSAIMLSKDREVAIVILINSDDKNTNELKNKLREELWEEYGSQQSVKR